MVSLPFLLIIRKKVFYLKHVLFYVYLFSAHLTITTRQQYVSCCGVTILFWAFCFNLILYVLMLYFDGFNLILYVLLLYDKMTFLHYRTYIFDCGNYYSIIFQCTSILSIDLCKGMVILVRESIIVMEVRLLCYMPVLYATFMFILYRSLVSCFTLNINLANPNGCAIPCLSLIRTLIKCLHIYYSLT